MNTASALYAGAVVHKRLRPRRHRLRYRVFSLLLDLDELPALDRRLRLFGHNRRAPIRFNDTDHGDGRTAGLRGWVEGNLRRAGIEPDGGNIRVLCYPRIFGFVFNPLTVFYCHDAGGALVAVLYEVNNTHSERHTYVIAVDRDETELVRQSCPKAMFVSPFVEMDCTYHFRLRIPGEKAVVSISEHDRTGPLLAAAFSGRRRPLTDRTLLWALLAYPLMTFKVITAIHLEAVRLWMKGIPVHAHRPATKRTSPSVVRATAHFDSGDRHDS